MTLPATLTELVAMGRDALNAVVAFYVPIFGLGHWQIAARWSDAEQAEANAGKTLGIAGWCNPNPVYEHATIEILWPPMGDVEETIVHELAHCARAMLAALAGAFEEGSWARAEYEADAEQTARGMVALRRHGARTPKILPRVLTRFCRSRFAAMRRGAMDPTKLAELAMKAGEMAARDDVPEDARQLFTEFVAALAGGGASTETETDALPEATDDPNAPPMAVEEEEKVPGYMRTLLADVASLKAAAAKPANAATAPLAGAPSTELVELRRQTVENFLVGKDGLLSPEMERGLIARGDLKLARSIVAEIERKSSQRTGARPPEVKPAKRALTPTEQKMARRHKLTDDQFAGSLQRQTDRKALVGRGGN